MYHCICCAHAAKDIEKVREVLQPLKNMADLIDLYERHPCYNKPCKDDHYIVAREHDDDRAIITMGDCRRARDVLDNI